MVKKKTIKILLIFGIILIAIGIFISIYYYKNQISFNDIIYTDVDSKIKILRDNKGIPLIKSSTKKDFYFSLGYTHAIDKLVIMEYYKSISTGNLEEEGNDFLNKLVRILNIYGKALDIENNLPDEYKKYIDAYVHGINFAKNKTIIGKTDNERWSSTDVISIILFLEWSNSFLNNKEFIFQCEKNKDKNINIIKKILPEKFISYYKKDQKNFLEIITKIKTLLNKYLGNFNQGYAFYIKNKNNLKSSLGISIDSSLKIYPSWTPILIKLNDHEIKGITFAGIPFIFHGNNKIFSFSSFTLDVDTQDFYIHKTKKIKNITHYKGKYSWKEFKIKRNPVKSLDKNINFEISWITDTGPVLNNIFDNKNSLENVLTIKSIFPEENYITFMLDIPFQKSVKDIKKIIKKIDSLPRIFLIVSEKESIRVPIGKMPVRNKSKNIFAAPNSVVWKKSKDLSQYAKKLHSNNIIGSSFFKNLPHFLRTRGRTDKSREKRLYHLLEKLNDPKIKNIFTILSDTYSAEADDILPLFLSILGTNPITSARLTKIYFNSWNFRMDASLIAPALYSTILEKFIIETYKDDYKEIDILLKNNMRLISEKFYKVAKNSTYHYFDNKNTDNFETRENIFDIAFLKSMRLLNRKQGPIMENWRWGVFHKGHYNIPFKDILFIEKILSDIPDREFNGGISTLYKGIFNQELSPKQVTCLIGVFNNSTGEIKTNYSISTNPLSKFYDSNEKNREDINLMKQEYLYKTEILPVK